VSKWHVVVDGDCSYPDDRDARVWTLSRNKDYTGWETDSGFNGYGLTKADAEELASAANRIEALEKALADIAVINNKRDRFSNEIDAIIYASKGTEE